MIKVLDYLKSLNIENNDFLIYQGKHYKVKDILDFESKIDLSPIHQGDVVALIGDFTCTSCPFKSAFTHSHIYDVLDLI